MTLFWRRREYIPVGSDAASMLHTLQNNAMSAYALRCSLNIKLLKLELTSVALRVGVAVLGRYATGCRMRVPMDGFMTFLKEQSQLA